MSRKDFELIARVVSNITNWNARRTAANLFATEIAYTNPRFDRGRFMEACGCTKIATDLPLLNAAE